jgi:hypothetical protein
MIRPAYLLMALCVFSIVASAQEDPLAWFPLQVGSRWVYEHEWKSADRNRPDVDHWTTEETVTGWVNIAEGLVVLREVKELGQATGPAIRVIGPDGRLRFVQGKTHGAYLITRDSAPYLVNGNCIRRSSYHVSPARRRTARRAMATCHPLQAISWNEMCILDVTVRLNIPAGFLNHSVSAVVIF